MESTPSFTLKGACLFLGLLLLTGCATALKRDAKCLAHLTPGYLSAQQELTSIDAQWREAGYTASLVPSPSRNSDLLLGKRPAQAVAEDSYASRLSQARNRHHQVLEWYPRVYERMATRLEEEQILSEVRWVLLGNPPSLIFYPIIRWNIHSVMWDGTDPDAGSDPVNQFCATQLVEDTPAKEPRGTQSR